MEKYEKLWLNTAITLDPEIVAGPIIYQIEALIKLYKIWQVETQQPNFLGRNSLVFISFGGKKSENCDWMRP